jgi:membrane associated rhomboid family serine protease
MLAVQDRSVVPWPPRAVPVILAVWIVFVWFVVACAQHRPTAEFVPNQSLFTFGGANGTSLAPNQWWRLLSSQLLHVHLLHATLNAAAIMFIGSAIQQRLGVW